MRSPLGLDISCTGTGELLVELALPPHVREPIVQRVIEDVADLPVGVVEELHMLAQHGGHDADVQAVRSDDFEPVDEPHRPVRGMER